MFDKLIEKAIEIVVAQAPEQVVESNSITVTSDYLTGPKNMLPPLLPFLPNNTTGKWLAVGVFVIGSVYLLATSGFMAIAFWFVFTYGLYALLYGGTVLQSPPALSVSKVYHFLGWKARLIGLFFVVWSGMLLLYSG